MDEKTKSPAEIAVEKTANEIDHNAERRKRIQELQFKESERKQRERKQSRDGQEFIVKEAREKIFGINRSAEDQRWMSASWTNRHGNICHRSGPGVVALDPDVSVLPDLLVEDNLSSVQTVVNACSRAMDKIKELSKVLREDSAAMPADLEGHVAEIIASIPPLSSIQIKVTCPAEPAKEEAAGDKET